MRLKLFPKFVLILVLLAVIPAAIVGIRTIQINREGMQAAILELHTNTATNIANDVSTHLKNLEREIQYILKTLSAQMTWTDRQSVLQALLDTNENFASVSIVSKKGEELLKAYNPALLKDPRLVSRSNDETFREFWKQPKNSAISDVYFVEDEPRMNIIYPLGKDHCLYTTITLKTLWDEIANTRIASTGYAFVVNKKGEIIAHKDVALAKNKTSALELPIVEQLLSAVSVGSSEYVHPQTNKKIVGAYAPVQGLSWGVVIQQDKSEAYVSVSKMQKQALILILISIAAASFLALSIARGLTRPIVRITEAARHIANRDFSQKVMVSTRDELQNLAETFNDMTMELDRFDKLQVDKIVAEKTKTEAVIFSIPDGIVMTDDEGRIQIANKLAKELLELPDAGWQEQSISAIAKNQEMKKAFESIITNPEENNAFEVNLSMKELARYYLFKTEEVISPQNNEKIGLVTVLRNITLEKELDRMKDDFLHSITHDLRNPMTSIRGFLKFLMDGVAGPISEQQKKMLSVMDSASLKLLGLINDILDIAKLESGRMTINLSECDLKTIAQKSIEISEGLALKKNVKIKLNAAPEHFPRIKCDPDLIERVFSNLLGNALKFSYDGSVVTANLSEHENGIQATVSDQGEGIPPEYVEKIFTKFQQVAGQRKGGTGLGLTICKHIVEAHLGKIWVESKLGEGSKFIFTLPKNPEPLMNAQQKDPQRN
ncbi:MAG: HAMP domain-containing protein [Endomicrobiales bacterium]|nr:HAMP domain-containing protein [Endomicrobiales bacterium]